MLEVTGLHYTYNEKKKRKTNETSFCLENISFCLEKGYMLALLGLNGAGKSTLLNLIMGMYKPDSGSVCLHGEEVSADMGSALNRIACISDRMGFLKYHTLEENVELFGILYDNFQQEKWRGYMEDFGFKQYDERRCYDELSTGQKRKFQLAFALSHEPELLLLDEPTANLDPHARQEWMELLEKQISEEKLSVVMSTHITSDLDEIADYILVLDRGRQLAFMDREEMVDLYGEIELSELLSRMVMKEL